MSAMGHDALDTAALRAADADARTVAALCDALDAARDELRRTQRALAEADGEFARAAKRVELAQQARTAAEVERSRFYLGLSAAQAACHAVIADKDATAAEHDLARRVLTESRRRA